MGDQGRVALAHKKWCVGEWHDTRDECTCGIALSNLALCLRDAAMLQRASDGANNRLMRRLLHAIEHDPTWHGHRGTRHELSARVRTWWCANRGDSIDPTTAGGGR